MNSLLKSLVYTFLFMCILQSCTQHDSDVSERILKISGSESEISLMNELIRTYYKEADSTIQINIKGGGSGLGIKNLITGESDIALSSRPVDSMEIKNCKAFKDLSQFIIARDVVAIVCNSSCGVSTLSFDQLKAIFEGRVKNWSELGGSVLPIHAVGRNPNSGTYHYIKNRINVADFSSGTQEVHDNDELIHIIQITKGAIGYVNMGTLANHSDSNYRYVTPIKTYIEGGEPHSPFEKEAIMSGDYPLVRPLFNYITAGGDERKMRFIEYILSDKVQARMESLGYLPINKLHQTINSKYLAKLNLKNK